MPELLIDFITARRQRGEGGVGGSDMATSPHVRSSDHERR